jgi:hypothetical protein
MKKIFETGHEKLRFFETSHGRERDSKKRPTIDPYKPVFTGLRPYIVVDTKYSDITKILQVGGFKTPLYLYTVTPTKINLDFYKIYTIETDKNGIYIDQDPYIDFRLKDSPISSEGKFFLYYKEREDGGDGPAVHGVNVPFDIELIFVTNYMSKFYFLSWLHLPKGSGRATDLDVVAEDPSSINKKLTTYCSHGVF